MKKNINQVSERIVNWIDKYATKANIDTLIVGVSGGIDSSVVSTLCAMTGKKTIIVEMPIRTNENYTLDEESVSTKHVKFLEEKFDNIQSEFVDLTTSFNTVRIDINQQSNQSNTENYKLSLANLASRLRMLTLYSFSNTYGGLVVGTGNKVEDYGIGFFTVGGDGQVDISPIADLLKSEVYQLGKHLGVIPEILSSKPTDGLWDDGRTDEDQIGASYDELEWAMNFVQENWFWEQGMEHEGLLDYDPIANEGIIHGEEILLSDREKVVLEIYLHRHNKNKFKMQLPPVCDVGFIK